MSHAPIPVATGAGIAFLGIALGYWIVVPITVLLTILAVVARNRFRRGRRPEDL